MTAMVAVVVALALAGAACGGDSKPVATVASTTTVPSAPPRSSTTAPTSPVPTSTTPQATALLGEDFRIALGESVAIVGEDLTVAYLALLADSRCPPDVTCITAGNATLSVSVAGAGGGGSTLQLNTTEGPTSGTYLAYTVTLVDLAFGPSPAARMRVSRS